MIKYGIAYCHASISKNGTVARKTIIIVFMDKLDGRN